MPAKKSTSKRELIEPTKGEKRFVRRNTKGQFKDVVDVGAPCQQTSTAPRKRPLPKARATAATQSVNAFSRMQRR